MDALSADSVLVLLPLQAPKTTLLQMSKLCIYTCSCMINTEADASGLSDRAITRLGLACDATSECI